MKLYKNERVLTTPQGSSIETEDGKKVLNFCTNNYIGFAKNEDIKKQLSGVLKTGGFIFYRFGLSAEPNLFINNLKKSNGKYSSDLKMESD